MNPEGDDDAVKVFFPPGHYHSPIPDTQMLASEPARSRVWPPHPRPTPGIDWRGQAQLELCSNVFARQEPMEFTTQDAAGPHDFYFGKGPFAPLDAWVLQALLRHLNPALAVEVGAGFSSLVTARTNREYLDQGMRFTCIDPYPRDFLVGGVPGITELRVEEVQETPLALFEELSERDVLFIDSSHAVKTGGDVPWIFNEILPRLQPGVLVHIHDAFLPGDYPPEWVLEGWGWNELYLIQSFLAFNWAFEIVFSVQWMIQHHWDALVDAFPVLGQRPQPGCSLWIRRAS